MTIEPRPYLVRSHGEFLIAVMRIRKSQRLSIKTLAAQLGVWAQHLAKQLNGTVTPLAPSIWAIADALGYDIALIPRQPKEQP